jgi:hypothetical protein
VEDEFDAKECCRAIHPTAFAGAISYLLAPKAWWRTSASRREATPVGATREGFYHRILLDVGSRRQRRSDHQAAASRPDQASKALQSLIGFRVRL